MISLLGNFYKHLAIFSGHTKRKPNWELPLVASFNHNPKELGKSKHNLKRGRDGKLKITSLVAFLGRSFSSINVPTSPAAAAKAFLTPEPREGHRKAKAVFQMQQLRLRVPLLRREQQLQRLELDAALGPVHAKHVQVS